MWNGALLQAQPFNEQLNFIDHILDPELACVIFCIVVTLSILMQLSIKCDWYRKSYRSHYQLLRFSKCMVDRHGFKKID